MADYYCFLFRSFFFFFSFMLTTTTTTFFLTQTVLSFNTSTFSFSSSSSSSLNHFLLPSFSIVHHLFPGRALGVVARRVRLLPNNQNNRILDDQCFMVPYDYDDICQESILIREPYSCSKNTLQPDCLVRPIRKEHPCTRVGSRWVSYECIKSNYRIECVTRTVQSPQTCHKQVLDQEPYDCMLPMSVTECFPEQVQLNKTCTKLVSQNVTYACLAEEWVDLCEEVDHNQMVRAKCQTTTTPTTQNVAAGRPCTKPAGSSPSCRKVRVSKDSICSKTVQIHEPSTCFTTDPVTMTTCKPTDKEEPSTCYREMRRNITYACLGSATVEDCTAVPTQESSKCYKKMDFKNPDICVQTDVVQQCHEVERAVLQTCYQDVKKTRYYKCTKQGTKKQCGLPIPPDSEHARNVSAAILSSPLPSTIHVLGLDEHHPYLPKIVLPQPLSPQPETVDVGLSGPSPSLPPPPPSFSATFLPFHLASAWSPWRSRDLRDFEGIWRLDIQRSEPVTPILRRFGLASVVHRLVEQFVTILEYVIEESATGVILLHSRTELPLNQEKLLVARLDGTPFNYQDPHIGDLNGSAYYYDGELMQAMQVNKDHDVTAVYESRIVLLSDPFEGEADEEMGSSIIFRTPGEIGNGGGLFRKKSTTHFDDKWMLLRWSIKLAKDGETVSTQRWFRGVKDIDPE